MANQNSRRFAATAACAALIIASGPAAAQPALDPSFGNAGTVLIDYGGSSFSNALLRQPDGKVVVLTDDNLGGAGNAIAISRHLSDGGLDPAFGSGGTILKQYTWRDLPYGMTLQPDGKIVAVGIRSDNNQSSHHRASIYRFHPDGSTDSTFSDDGWSTVTYPSNSSAAFADVTVLPDGRILAVGLCSILVGPGAARFLPNGEIDPSYGARVFPLEGLYSDHGHACFTEDGGFLFATQIVLPGTTTWEFVLLRVDGAGEQVMSFGSGGFVLPGVATHDDVHDARVSLLPDGRILLAGTTLYAPNQRQYTVLRLEPDGTLDPSFGIAGRADVPIGVQNDLYDMHVTPGGKIVLAGTAVPSTGQPARCGLARLTPDGALDTDFAPGGIFTIDLSAGFTDYFRQCFVDDEGRIVVAGRSGLDLVLARFTPPVAEVGTPINSLSPLVTAIAPNPMRAGSRIEFTLDRPDRIRLSVIDPTGRRIRTLADRTFAAGSGAIAWDGRDDDGRRVPPGIYFTHLVSEGTPLATTSRVVVLR
ncbi:MAG: hypothetical protein IPK72_17490 [Candidatus Eisenbacteria bacterium]|nr:hypothetical protein [Candidatus Eisenbacteria bacterium]